MSYLSRNKETLRLFCSAVLSDSEVAIADSLSKSFAPSGLMEKSTMDSGNIVFVVHNS